MPYYVALATAPEYITVTTAPFEIGYSRFTDLRSTCSFNFVITEPRTSFRIVAYQCFNFTADALED